MLAIRTSVFAQMGSVASQTGGAHGRQGTIRGHLDCTNTSVYLAIYSISKGHTDRRHLQKVEKMITQECSYPRHLSSSLNCR